MAIQNAELPAAKQTVLGIYVTARGGLRAYRRAHVAPRFARLRRREQEVNDARGSIENIA
jgi:hypothetical protein